MGETCGECGIILQVPDSDTGPPHWPDRGLMGGPGMSPGRGKSLSSNDRASGPGLSLEVGRGAASNRWESQLPSIWLILRPRQHAPPRRETLPLEQQHRQLMPHEPPHRFTTRCSGIQADTNLSGSVLATCAWYTLISGGWAGGEGWGGERETPRMTWPSTTYNTTGTSTWPRDDKPWPQAVEDNPSRIVPMLGAHEIEPRQHVHLRARLPTTEPIGQPQ